MNTTTSQSIFRHGMAKWGLFMFCLFALWFGGWFVFAHYADKKIVESLSAINERGVQVECDNRKIKGFPFRIGVNCDAVKIAHKRDVYRVELGALRTTAILYAPGEMIAEVDGPLRTWPQGVELNGDWSRMRLFVDGKLDGGFDLASLSFSNVVASTRDLMAKLEDGAVHIRPTPMVDGGDPSEFTSLDIASNLKSISLALSGATFPNASFEVDGTLKDGYRDLVLDRMPLRSVLRNGAQVDLRNLALLVPREGRLALAGPLQIDAEGFLNGALRIGIANPDAVANWAGQVSPQFQQIVRSIGQAVAGMGKKARIGREEMRSIKIKIDRGVVRLGFIQFGEVPPLELN